MKRIRKGRLILRIMWREGYILQGGWRGGGVWPDLPPLGENVQQNR